MRIGSWDLPGKQKDPPQRVLIQLPFLVWGMRGLDPREIDRVGSTKVMGGVQVAGSE
jgi:hypothetical protein